MARLDRSDIERLLARTFRLVLRGVDLTGADLSGLDLRHADLTNAVLVRTQLFDARLDGACLQGADLSGARAYRAHFRGADLRGARLHQVSFRHADLLDADLRGAEMRYADFVAAEVGGVLIDEGVDLDSEAVGFGQPTRTIGVVIQRDEAPHPATREHLTAIPDLDDVGVIGFEGIPDVVLLAIYSTDLTDQFVATAAIGNLGPRLLIAGGLPTLLEALLDPDYEVRGQAMELLAMCGEEARPAITPLVAMLGDPEPETCVTAVHALAEIGLAEPEVLAALHAACEHADERVRGVAKHALVTVKRGPKSWG